MPQKISRRSNSLLKEHVEQTTNAHLSADEIRKFVNSELGNTQMVTDTASFFDNIIALPVERVQNIMDHLNNKGLYSGETWKALPATTTYDGPESNIYKPLVHIANEISRYVDAKGWIGPEQIKGRWVDCNATPPISLESPKSFIRPDCAFVSNQTHEKILEDWRKDHEKQSIPLTRGKARKLKGEVEPKERIRWLQMLGAVEIKTDQSPEATEASLEQLCSYAREMFRNQPDRRFVIGLTLCANSLRTYLFDRSGVFGINEDIDINQQPLRFIQALAAFSLLHPEDLGSDLTMSIFHNNNWIPSFSFPWQEMGENYTPQWVIDVDGESYIILRALNTTDAQVMCGRATLVWEVCEISEFRAKNVNAEILVLKQSWQRLPGKSHAHPDLGMTPFEEYVYRRAELAPGRLQKGTFVRDRKMEIVSTESSIRHNVAMEAAPLKRLGPKKQSSTPSEARETSSKSASNRSSGLTDVEAQALKWKSRSSEAFTDRRLTRIPTQRRGEPLSRFKDLVEFVKVLLDAVKVHEKLYNAGILHRDISPNNILIRHSSQQAGDEVGDLVDYDHAKITNSFEMWWKMQDWSDRMDIDGKVHELHAILKLMGAPLTFSAVERVLRVLYYANVSSYFYTIFDRFPSRRPTSQNEEMELEHLHLKEPASSQPFFLAEVGRGERTGTLVYMSHKLLGGAEVVHDAIHDMESFLWIIIEYALTRDGPGGSERPLTEELAGLLYSYFDSGLETKKTSLFPSGTNYFAASKKLEDELISHFHPYFRPIEDLVKELWKTLYTALEYQGFEAASTHFYVKSILAKAVQGLQDNPPPEHEFTAKEVRRRQKLDDAVKNAIREQRMVLPEDLEV